MTLTQQSNRGGTSLVTVVLNSLANWQFCVECIYSENCKIALDHCNRLGQSAADHIGRCWSSLIQNVANPPDSLLDNEYSPIHHGRMFVTQLATTPPWQRSSKQIIIPSYTFDEPLPIIPSNWKRIWFPDETQLSNLKLETEDIIGCTHLYLELCCAAVSNSTTRASIFQTHFVPPWKRTVQQDMEGFDTYVNDWFKPSGDLATILSPEGIQFLAEIKAKQEQAKKILNDSLKSVGIEIVDESIWYFVWNNSHRSLSNEGFEHAPWIRSNEDYYILRFYLSLQNFIGSN